MSDTEKTIQFVVSVPADTDVCVIDMGRGIHSQSVDIKGNVNAVRLSLSGARPEKAGDPGA